MCSGPPQICNCAISAILSCYCQVAPKRLFDEERGTAHGSYLCYYGCQSSLGMWSHAWSPSLQEQTLIMNFPWQFSTSHSVSYGEIFVTATLLWLLGLTNAVSVGVWNQSSDFWWCCCKKTRIIAQVGKIRHLKNCLATVFDIFATRIYIFQRMCKQKFFIIAGEYVISQKHDQPKFKFISLYLIIC